MWSKFTAASVDETKKVSTRKYFEKFVKCAYLMIRKKWALSINFEELDAVMRICHEGPIELDESLLQKIPDDFISAKDRKIKLN